jgi:DNA-binding LytR/AlgR family response regulator
VLSTDLLAIVVAIVAFIVSGIFLLTLVPDRTRPGADLATHDVAAPDAGAAKPAPANVVELGQGTFGPLGGAGGPPRRIAQQLPVERDGGTHFVPIDDVVAVHANAHYTYIFDGKTKLFCSLPIGVVESRLDPGRFARVHRSHIVALDRIVGLKRAGETGLIELAALEPYTVPVSRGRLAWLKSRLALTTGDTDRTPPVGAVEPSFAAQHR